MLVRRVWPGRPTFNGSLSDFEQVRREMLRLFDSVASESPATATGVFPPLNVTQDEEKVYVRAEIPGIDPDQLSLSVLRNRVAIAGKREIQLEKERVAWHRRERPEGTFSRTLTLPVEVDADRVEARYTDGVLTLTLAKAEAAKPRQIAVRS